MSEAIPINPGPGGYPILSGTVCCRANPRRLLSWRFLVTVALTGFLLAPVGTTPAGEVPGPGKQTVSGEAGPPARNTSQGRKETLDADAGDNPDQGQGWQMPGTKARKKPQATPATRPGAPLDKDAADNPDQGAGWQVPGTGGRTRPKPTPSPAPAAPPRDEDAGDNPDQGAGWQMPGRGDHQ